MELAVGLMLVLLGVLNLTGVMQWTTVRSASNLSRLPQVHLDDLHKWSVVWNLRERIGLYQVLRPLIVGNCVDLRTRRRALRQDRPAQLRGGAEAYGIRYSVRTDLTGWKRTNGQVP